MQPDPDRHGAGWARNRGVEQVTTPFVFFLDADDWIEPHTIETLLRTYENGHYVYCGWHAGDRLHMPAAQTPFANGGYHLVSSLIPTAAFRYVGGFDESLPGYEDTDLFLKLARIRVCGKLKLEHLIHYTDAGQRSKHFLSRPDMLDIKDLVYKRNGGEFTVMCCGIPGTPTPLSPGDQQPGDVYALALWAGIHTEGSRVNPARQYRGGNGQPMWVNEADAKARPDLWKILPSSNNLTPDRQDVLSAAGLL